MKPALAAAAHNALCTENRAVIAACGEFPERFFKLCFGENVRRFNAPACEHIVGMMMVVMVMVMAAMLMLMLVLVFVFVFMLMVVLMLMVMTAMLVMVVMMVLPVPVMMTAFGAYVRLLRKAFKLVLE